MESNLSTKCNITKQMNQNKFKFHICRVGIIDEKVCDSNFLPQKLLFT